MNQAYDPIASSTVGVPVDTVESPAPAGRFSTTDDTVTVTGPNGETYQVPRNALDAYAPQPKTVTITGPDGRTFELPAEELDRLSGRPASTAPVPNIPTDQGGTVSQAADSAPEYGTADQENAIIESATVKGNELTLIVTSPRTGHKLSYTLTGGERADEEG